MYRFGCSVLASVLSNKARGPDNLKQLSFLYAPITLAAADVWRLEQAIQTPQRELGLLHEFHSILPTGSREEQGSSTHFTSPLGTHCLDMGAVCAAFASPSPPMQIVYYLSGLTCTDENVIQKSGAQRKAAELGLALIAPDTSPRGLDTPGGHG